MIERWYRQPAPGEVDTIRSFKIEGQLHAASAVGCVVLGDLNVTIGSVEVPNNGRFGGFLAAATCCTGGRGWPTL